jgi:hypothetical protein
MMFMMRIILAVSLAAFALAIPVARAFCLSQYTLYKNLIDLQRWKILVLPSLQLGRLQTNIDGMVSFM